MIFFRKMLVERHIFIQRQPHIQQVQLSRTIVLTAKSLYHYLYLIHRVSLNFSRIKIDPEFPNLNQYRIWYNKKEPTGKSSKKRAENQSSFQMNIK
jgi:hypothetical protein